MQGFVRCLAYSPYTKELLLVERDEKAPIGFRLWIGPPDEPLKPFILQRRQMAHPLENVWRIVTDWWCIHLDLWADVPRDHLNVSCIAFQLDPDEFDIQDSLFGPVVTPPPGFVYPTREDLPHASRPRKLTRWQRFTRSLGVRTQIAA